MPSCIFDDVVVFASELFSSHFIHMTNNNNCVKIGRLFTFVKSDHFNGFPIMGLG